MIMNVEQQQKFPDGVNEGDAFVLLTILTIVSVVSFHKANYLDYC